LAFQKRRAASGQSETKDAARPLSPERLEKRARNVLLHQLARSAKSKHQLAQVMIQREIPAEIFEPLLDRFEEAGLINDLSFAETIVASRRAGRGLSAASIKRELRTKGIGESLIEQVTESITAEDELQLATSLAIRRARSMTQLAPEVRKRRLVGFLQRKGYGQHAVFTAIRAAEIEAVKSEF
jgi:regulatory protein